jgi:putative sigma-54 modulation protein
VSISEEFAPKPMSVEEAIMQLDASGEEFFAFVNEQTDEVNVVFRKKDGGYGLLRRSF